MPDSDEQYLPQQKLQNASDDFAETDGRSQIPARASRMRGGQRARRFGVASTTNSLLPERGLWYALIAGVVAGLLDVLLNILITVSNAGTYQHLLAEGKNPTLTTANIVGGLLCLSLFINIVIFGVTGYLVGRFAVQRRLGFLAGVLIGAIAYLASFLVRYIPNYPGNTATSGATNLATIGVTLTFLLLSALIGGLISVIGTWLATRKHPYYTA